MYFLLAWFHAIIQERLRYAPLGWSKKYEFGESDLRSACDTVDTWLDDTAKASVGCAVRGGLAYRWLPAVGVTSLPHPPGKAEHLSRQDPLGGAQDLDGPVHLRRPGGQ